MLERFSMNWASNLELSGRNLSLPIPNQIAQALWSLYLQNLV
jgi:hypothetical protein